MVKYGFIKETGLSFQTALENVKRELSDSGFSILWEMDVKSKIKEKLGKDFSDYMILGACNAPIAYSVLTHEIESGLLLPCNIVVYEQASKVFIGYLQPTKVLGLTENEGIIGIASEAETILKEVFNKIN